VAKGRKTGGRNFQPGQSGNPKGAPNVPEDVKAIRRLTRSELDRLFNKFIFMTKTEIQRAVMDPAAPSLELWISSVIHKGVVEGDDRRMNSVFDRLLGKVKDHVEHSTKDGAPLVILTMPRNGREAPIDPPAKKEKKSNGGS
jgi:hypothetical protein